jgi:hypothetical protein
MELNSCGDTTICFNIPQSKFLLKSYYKSIKFENLNSICEIQSAIKDSAIAILKLKCIEKDSIIADDSTYILIQNNQVKFLNQRVYIAHKEAIKQTIYKWAAIVIGSVVSLLEFSHYKN